MPAEFVPVVQQRNKAEIVEMFVSGNESLTIMTNIFVSAGIMIFAMIITWLFIWSYNKDKLLFISIISIVAILFAIENIIIILINMDKYDPISFKVTMGSNILCGIIFFIVAIVFFIRFFQNRRSSSASSYVPSNVQSYIDQ